METIADILLVAGALGAGVYCFVLARRLARFNDLEKAASDSSGTLDDLTKRAETVAGRLEILVASLHDLTEEPKTASAPPGPISGEPIFTRHGRADRAGTP